MAFTLKPGIRERVGLIIGLVGPSGSGKTYSAMELAAGICGDRPFALIDTENRRGLHYADAYNFNHGDLEPPFNPAAYTEAIDAAERENYGAIVLDNMSHEWIGDGGLLDWQEAELTRMAGDDWKKRERVKMASWIKPKMAHKKMVQRLLRVKTNLILCFRAEEKTGVIKKNGKMEVVNLGWQPITEKTLPYELTCSLLLTPENPGYPIPLKLQEQHKHLFPEDRQINKLSGELMAKWAEGGVPASIGEVMAEIGNAATLDELRAVGAAMAAKKLSREDTQAAREAYKIRQAELKGA